MDLIKECEELIKEIWPGYSYTGWPVFTILVSIVISLSKVIYNKFKANKTRRILKKFTKEEVKKHNEYYINPTGTSPDINNGEPFKIIKHFKRRVFPFHDTSKHYIILGDSGTGKTSLLINLVLKSTRLLQFWQKYNLILIPIRSIASKNDITKLLDKYDPEQCILLLDGLDEDNIARTSIEARLQQLYDWTIDFRKIIITCRTQFFSSDKEFPKKTTVNYFTEGGKYFQFKHVFIQPFSKKQVKQFLRKKYRLWKVWKPLNVFKRETSKKLVFDFQDINSRPLLLTYVNDLLPANKNILKITSQLWGLRLIQLIIPSQSPIRTHFVQQLEQSIDRLYSQSAYTTKTMVYRIIIKRWIDRESERIRDDKEREKHQRALFQLALLASYLIFYESMTNNKLSVSKDKLFEKAVKQGIDLSNIDISSRSLLFRNSEGEFIFAHKSILEYFLAIYATQNVKLSSDISNQNGWDNYNYFFYEIMTIGKILPFFQDVGSKISFKYHEHGYFESPENRPTLESITKAISLKITDDIGYVDSNLFATLGNLSIDAYWNIADYLVHKQHYCFDEIVDMLNMLNQHNDEEYSILEKIIDVYEYMKLYGVAAKYMKEYIDLMDIPFQYPEHERLIEFYRKNDDKENFLPLRERFFKEHPGKHFRHFFYINDLHKKEYYNEAIAAYLQFEGDFDYKLEIHALIIKSYLNIDNFKEAISLYKKYSEEFPSITLISVLNAFSNWYEKQDKFDESLHFIEKEFIRVKEENEIEVGVLYASKLFIKDKDKSSGVIQKLESKYNTDTVFFKRLTLYYRGIKDYDSALKAALKYIENAPESFLSYNHTAICYNDLKDTDHAIQYYKLAIEKIEPNKSQDYLHSIIYFNFADTLRSASLFDEAIEYYKKAIEIADEDEIEDYNLDLAESYENIEKWEEAFYIYAMLWARFHKSYHLSKMADASVNTKDLRHIFRVHTLLKKNNDLKATERLNASRQSVVNYLIEKEILVKDNDEIEFRKELYQSYYDNLIKLFLAN